MAQGMIDHGRSGSTLEDWPRFERVSGGEIERMEEYTESAYSDIREFCLLNCSAGTEQREN